MYTVRNDSPRILHFRAPRDCVVPDFILARLSLFNSCSMSVSCAEYDISFSSRIREEQSLKRKKSWRGKDPEKYILWKSWRGKNPEKCIFFIWENNGIQCSRMGFSYFPSMENLSWSRKFLAKFSSDSHGVLGWRAMKSRRLIGSFFQCNALKPCADYFVQTTLHKT